MSTTVEDPGIPLVGTNGRSQLYSEDIPAKRKRKFDNVGYRLAKRKELFQRRKVICDFALFFAIVGIILMMIETELFMAGVFKKDGTASLIMKFAISLSTVTLLGFILWYHALDVKLYMSDNSLDDWTLAMSSKRIVFILLEVVVCAIHPLPGRYDFSWEKYDPMTGRYTTITVPIDVTLSVPMFLRLFLVCRVFMLHSKLFTDASSQSLGALNRINFNFKFIFKSMMTMCPEYVLTVLMVSVLLISSWLLRACEMYHDDAHSDFLNTMWLVSITFLSVGYGDIVPESYCGRGVAVLTGMFGAGCTALVVAVLARKLELSRAEKYVHNFVIDVELDKRNRAAAADIIRAGWYIFKYKRLGRDVARRRYQRKLLKAIHHLRDIKHEQRRLMDSGVTLIEMYRMQNGIFDMMTRFETQQAVAEQRVVDMELKLSSMEAKLDVIHNLMMSSGMRK